MPIPNGAHYIPGEPNRVQLAGGDIVTRAYARTLGARELGYKNEHDYRGNATRDSNYVRSMLQGAEGERIREIAKENNTSPRELKHQLLMARNQRPHGNRSGGPAYQEFMDEYEMWDQEDWIDY